MSGSLMPELSPTQAESHTTPWVPQGKAGHERAACSLPRHTLCTMTKDHDLRAIQRQNDLAVFIRYENALRAAYAKSKDPHPRRRMCEDSSR